MPAWLTGSTWPFSPTSQTTSATDSISRCISCLRKPKNSPTAVSPWASCSSRRRKSLISLFARSISSDSS